MVAFSHSRIWAMLMTGIGMGEDYRIFPAAKAESNRHKIVTRLSQT
jgi:hypothetical protein